MYATYVIVLCIVVVGVAADSCYPRTYAVRLSNNGPTATTIPIINKHVRTPTLERMPLRTAGCIPRPKTIDNVCTCYKTVVKPQVHNQIISVPSIQKVIQTSATPVVEKIHYEATPVDSPALYSYHAAYTTSFPTFGSFPYGGIVKPACTTSVVTVPAVACRSSTILL